MKKGSIYMYTTHIYTPKGPKPLIELKKLKNFLKNV